MIGLYIPANRHYYYVNFGERYRQPCDPKTPVYLEDKGKRCDDAVTQTERQNIQTETGICGKTILLELFKLYKFDPVNDMLIDKMHLSFNMLKKEFLEKMWSDPKGNTNLPPNDRDPDNGGIMSRHDFKDNLEKVVWTREQKASGVAKVKFLTDKLGGWKSDEYYK